MCPFCTVDVCTTKVLLLRSDVVFTFRAPIIAEVVIDASLGYEMTCRWHREICVPKNLELG